MNKIIKISFLGLALIIGFSFAGSAHAAAQFANGGTGELPLVGVQHCGASSSGCAQFAPYSYSPSVSNVQPGDVVWVQLYYHNIGNATATNTKFTLSPLTTSGSSVTFNGTLSADGVPAISGSATINLTSSQTVTWQSTRAFAHNGVEISGSGDLSSGYNIGSVDAESTCTVTYCKQGVVIVTFKVGQTTIPPVSQCTVSIYHSPTSPILYGGSTSVFWSSNNCTTVNVNGQNVSNNNFTGQAQTGALYNSSTYTITGSNGSSSDSKSTTVIVNPQQQTQSCYINYFGPSTSVNSGGSATLSWTTTGCTSAIISGGNFYGSVGLNDSRSTGAVYGTTTYTLTAYGTNGGTQTSTATISVYNQNYQTCAITSFYPYAYSVAAGNSTTLYWNTTGCTSVYVSGPGLSTNSQLSGTTSTNALYSSTTYTITAYGPNGNTPSQTTTVSVNQQQQNLSVVTGAATLVGSYSARLNGYFSQSNYAQTNVYFEWGTSTTLGSTTNSLNGGSNNSASFFDTLTGLAPSTTYYYRAVASNGSGVVRGDILNFTTNSATVVTPTTRTIYIREPATTTIVSGVGSGSNLVSLKIEDRSQTICVGDYVDYAVTYKNISGKTLNNVVVQVLLPQDVEFRSANPGIYNIADHTVTLSVGTLIKDQEGIMYVSGRVLRTAIDRDLITATATIAFTNPTNNSQESAIAYALNNTNDCSRSSLAGLALFGNGFWPTTLVGWLILILILLALVYLATRVYHTARRDAYRPAPRYEEMDIPTYNNH